MSGHASTVDDVRTPSGDEYFIVAPAAGGSGPGVIFLHWFDEAPNANRTQFLDEAKQLSEDGVVSILPQLRFPWSDPPSDSTSDRARIASELTWLLEIHTALTEREDVDPDQVALVGHDFGAMHGVLLLNEIEARAAVLIAPTPRWADWFLRFWPISTDRFDYLRDMDDLDPIRAVVTTAHQPTLFQFGDRDFYIALMAATELYDATPEPKTLLRYDIGHDVDLPEAVADRREFILDHFDIKR